MSSHTLHFFALGLLLAGSACISPSDPQPIRYFSVGPVRTGGSVIDAPGPELRLRRLSSASHLTDRMAWRRTDFEYGFYELRRWTETPIDFVRRALAESLFGRFGLRRSESNLAPSVDVELLAFEEVLDPEHAAVVSFAARLTTRDGTTLIDRRWSATEPIDGKDPEDVARAVAAALATSVEEAGRAIGAALGADG